MLICNRNTTAKVVGRSHIKYNVRVLSREEFQELVAEALDKLPQVFRARFENLVIVVEDWPDRRTLHVSGVKNRADLLGFYHGVPLTERTSNYGMIAPDKISIYRQPILLQCKSEEDVGAIVQRVVRHELAHYFGIDDERLFEIGAY